MTMSKPFDADRFNFMKISNEEILFDIDSGDGNNVISVNVSPITWGHSLFIPQRYQGLPQVVTSSSLKKAIELLLLSNSV